jgi:hypothetical protein
MQIITDGKDAATGAGQVGRLSTYPQVRPAHLLPMLPVLTHPCAPLCARPKRVPCAPIARAWVVSRTLACNARKNARTCGGRAQFRVCVASLYAMVGMIKLRSCARRRRILAMDVRIPPPSSAYPRRARLLDFASTQALPVARAIDSRCFPVPCVRSARHRAPLR